MSDQCRDCAAGLEHCHGALIHHAHRREECTEDGCLAPPTAHDMHLDCSAVGCACDREYGEVGAVSAHRVG